MKNRNDIVGKIRAAAWDLAWRELDGDAANTFGNSNGRILEQSKTAGEILEKAAGRAGISKEDKERLFKSEVVTPITKEDLDLLTKVYEILFRWQQESKIRK